MTALMILLALTGASFQVNWSAESIPKVETGVLGNRILMEGIPSIGAPGTPLMPAVPVSVILPEGAIVDAVKIACSNPEPFASGFVPMPAQIGVPLSRPGDFVQTPADASAFSVPMELEAVLQGQGTLMGYPVADILVRPFEWDPFTGDLAFSSSMTLHIEYHLEPSSFYVPIRGIVGNQVTRSILEASVLNPEMIPANDASSRDLPWGEYLIIADDPLADSFEPLAEFKTWKGIEARIVEFSYITDTYTGVDNAQKLRNFLFDIYQNNPPTYILLAGDTPGIPHRNCYATAEGYVGDPSSDLYYQDMNDTAPGVDAWNLDGDGTWGELNGDDNVDYHPDYILGRASVETPAEAAIFVDKILTWENTPDTADWYTSMGFTTSVLWSSPYCPGSAGKENVDTLYTPANWSIAKLYESTGTQSYSGTMAMLNTGMQLVNHAGHGSETSVSIGPGGYLGTSDFMGLTNVSGNGRPTIWNTIACLSGSFDTGTCLAESWIRSPNGGGFCIMNTRYGWGEPSEPGGQWSDLVDQEFFAKFFTEDMYQLGVAFMMAKDEFIPLIPSDTHYDWIGKSNTLFGDPELPMYTVEPFDIETGAINLNEGDPSVTITVTSEGSPLENARVCLLQGDWDDPVTYEVGLTDVSGSVVLTFPEPLPGEPDQARVTVWARDHHLNTQLITVGNLGTGGEESNSISTMTLLSSNPLRGTASISWSLPDPQEADISVIDLAGRTVDTQPLQGTSGLYSWNSQDNPAGVYFIRMTTQRGDVLQKRLVVIR